MKGNGRAGTGHGIRFHGTADGTDRVADEVEVDAARADDVAGG
jgi:hypothetical protein